MKEHDSKELYRCALELLAELERTENELVRESAAEEPEIRYTERRIVIESGESESFEPDSLLRREKLEQRRYDGGFEIY